MPPAKNKRRGVSARQKKDAVVEFEEPLDDNTLEEYLSRYPGLKLEMLGVPEDYLWIKFTQLAGQPPPRGCDLFGEYFTELAIHKGWNPSYYHDIWTSVLPWEQHFQWTNLASDLREEHQKKYPVGWNPHKEKVEMPPVIPGDEAMLSKPWTAEGLPIQGSCLQPTAAEPPVTSDKSVPLNDGAMPNRKPETSDSYTPESNEGPSNASYSEPLALYWNNPEAQEYANDPPNYGTLEENMKYLLGEIPLTY